MCCIALVLCVLVLRCGSAGVVWYRYAHFTDFHLNLHTAVTYTEWHIPEGRIYIIDSLDDEHFVSRNMYRIGINKYTKKNCKLVIHKDYNKIHGQQKKITEKRKWIPFDLALRANLSCICMSSYQCFSTGGWRNTDGKQKVFSWYAKALGNCDFIHRSTLKKSMTSLKLF